jgi:hypothetical protein
MKSRSLIPVVCSTLSLVSLAGCTPGATPAPTPTPTASTTTNCALAPGQTTQGLRVNCTVTATLANALLDPVDSTNTSCTPFNPNPTASNDLRDARLVTLSGQTLSAPVTLIYGAQGDDNSERVRVDINLGSSTHSAMLGKTPTDCSVPTVNFPVTTTFAGMHVALIDKTKTPMCVFQSRYTPASFSQVIGPGGPNVGAVTQASTEAAIARQLDLQAAKTVNGLLNPSANLGGAFATNFGRCDGDYQPFTG